MDIRTFADAMDRDGWAFFPDALDGAFVRRLREDTDRAYAVCRAIQIRNGVDKETQGTVHHLPEFADSFLELLEHFPMWEYVSAYFEHQPVVLHSLCGIVNPPHSSSYAMRMHRDIRTFASGAPVMLNTLVMLDDFTLENGATYLLSGSHRQAEKPPEESLANAQRAVGKAGSVLLFNSNLWHAGGYNGTDSPRRGLTPLFMRPYLKPLYDYPRALGYARGEMFSSHLRQVLGYNARVPASLEEWYQPPEKRMYKPGQG